ncbi:BnaA09g15900D [Brassica napus]|uniref:(rape) hypothetical protein n=1 Tax=Brassica napus TaxID=3708 RepID=A0A078HV16_BRANA|nr:unnamed protein product [Brassica napus]CDY42355.1 BnaA09g15900D [Brassica napus]
MGDQAANQCSSSNNASVESTLELNIKTLDSQTYTFKADKNEMVSVFKEKIASETGVPVAQQRLIFRGRVLKDDHPLSEYHLENGHTLHLIVRQQPAESMPSSDTPSEGAAANDGNGSNGGQSRGRGHISHSVVLGSFNSPDQTEGFGPDISRVIGAVLNSFGVGGQNLPNSNINVTQPSMPSNLSGHPPPGNASGGTPATGGQSQAPGQSQPRPAFTSAAFRASMPHVVQIPITAATTIPIPSFQTPIPDSLDTLMEFINRMEQALSRNGYQPDTSSATSEGRPREELPRHRQGPSTPEALAIVLRNSQRLLSGLAVSSLSHIAGRLEQDGSSSDPAHRAQIQSEAVQVGLAMQHLGALLLELGRTLLTLRMGQSQEFSYVNSGPAVYISPSGPNPIMVQPFPHQTSPLFTGAAGSSNPVTGQGGLGTPSRQINIHIHAGSSASPTMSSVGNHQSSGEQGEHNSNTSSVRVLPTRNFTAAPAPAPSHITGENVSAEIQSGASSAMTEQATNTVATSTPEESSPLRDLPSERSDSIGQRGKDHCEDSGHPEVDTTSDAKLTKKATPEVVTPLGLGLGGLDRKKRSKQLKTLGKNEDGGTSASVEGVQQGSGTSSQQQLLQSLFSGSSRGRGSDDGVDVSSAMSQVLESPVLDGLLGGVSRQAGVDSPNMLRNMLQQFTQNPQIMNTVQQIAQQVDGQEIENMMSGGANSEGGGGFDLSRMVQQMMPLVSRAFSQGGPSFEPALQQADVHQPLQANVQPMMQMIEHSDPPEDVFRAMVENAAMSQEDLADVLCSDEALANEYAELLRRDLEGRLQDNQGP